LRERGYFYLRLLEIDANLAKDLVLTEKPPISQESLNIDSSLLEKLIDNFGTLSVIYSKPPELFVKKVRRINIGEEEEYDQEDNNLIGDDEEEEENNHRNKGNNNKNEENDYSNNTAVESQFNSVGKLQDNSSIAQVNNGPSLIDLSDVLGAGGSIPQGNQINNNYNNMSNIQPGNQISSNVNLIDLDIFGSTSSNNLNNNSYNDNNLSYNNNNDNSNNNNASVDLMDILGNPSAGSGNNNGNSYQQNTSITSDIYNNTSNNNNDFSMQQNQQQSFNTNFSNPSRKLAIIPKMVKLIFKIFRMCFRKKPKDIITKQQVYHWIFHYNTDKEWKDFQ